MSTEIKNLTTHHLRNSAHMQFNFDVVALILEFSAARLGIAALFNVYQACVNMQDFVYKKIIKSEYTEKIKEADKKRDTVYKNIVDALKMLVRYHIAEIRDAARRLQIMVETFENVPQKSYDEQTGDITNILQEFRGKYAPDVELTKLTELVDELERTNKAFDELMKTRNEELSGKVTKTMQDARNETDDAYVAIRKRINALIEVEGPENYAEFVSRLNVVIDRYRLLLAKSHGKKKETKAAAKKKEPAKVEAKAVVEQTEAAKAEDQAAVKQKEAAKVEDQAAVEQKEAVKVVEQVNEGV